VNHASSLNSDKGMTFATLASRSVYNSVYYSAWADQTRRQIPIRSHVMSPCSNFCRLGVDSYICVTDLACIIGNGPNWVKLYKNLAFSPRECWLQERE